MFERGPEQRVAVGVGVDLIDEVADGAPMGAEVGGPVHEGRALVTGDVGHRAAEGLHRVVQLLAAAVALVAALPELVRLLHARV